MSTRSVAVSYPRPKARWLLFKRSWLSVSIALFSLTAPTRGSAEVIEFHSSNDDYFVPQLVSADGRVLAGFITSSGSDTGLAARWINGQSQALGSIGGQVAYARAVSQGGSVIVGQSEYSIGGPLHATRWRNGTVTDLGTLGGSESDAVALSSDGAVIVGTSDLAGDTYSNAFRWENGQMTDLGSLAGRGSYATAVSRDGSTVVGASYLAVEQHATLWKNGVTTDLGTLGGNRSYAVAVSGDGSVVVGNSQLSDNGFDHAFRWEAGALQDLGTLGGHYSVAKFLSDDGSVIVGQSAASDQVTNHTFRWVDGAMSNIGTLGAGDTFAYGMNASGSVIVGTSSAKGYRWSTEQEIQSIEDWLSENGVEVDTSALTVASARSVSDDGNVILGTLGNGHTYLARLASSDDVGAGLIDVNDYMAGLAAVRVQAVSMSMNDNDLAINGLHGSPMRGLLIDGKRSVWVSGDIGRRDHNDYAGKSGVGEFGVGLSLAEGVQLNLALGRTCGRQDGEYAAETRVEGTYFMPELIVRIPQTSVYVSTTLIYNDSEADIERGYLNAGVATVSRGKTDIRSYGGRLRLDWLNAFEMAQVDFTPYVSHTYLKSTLDAYTETGGGFPAAWDRAREQTQTSRVGLDMVYPVSPRLTFLGRVEGAHRYEDRAGNLEGDILGAGGSGFDIEGLAYQQNWLRLGTGVEAIIGDGIATLMLNGTNEGEDASYWITAGYRLPF